MTLTPITETDFRKNLKGCGISYYSWIPKNELKAKLGFCPTRKNRKKIEISDDSGFCQVFRSMSAAEEIASLAIIKYAIDNKRPTIKRRSDKKIFNIREIT